LSPTMAMQPPLIGQLQLDIFEQSLLEMLTHIPIPPLLKKAMQHGAKQNFSYIPFTPIFNISGQPAMSVPLYWSKQGLPLGTQFAAAMGKEELLFQLAAQLETALPWFDKRPI
jgi:amidase